MFSPSVFAIYLVNDNPLLRRFFIEKRLSSIADDNCIRNLGGVVGFSMIFLIISLLSDRIRLLIFKLGKK